MRFWKFFGLLTLWLASSAALAGSISMQLDRTVGLVGEPFYLTIILEGDVQSDLQLSQVPGLIFEGGGVSRNHSNVNGVVHREIRVSYQVRAEQEGSYTIPAVRADIDGKQEVSLPLTFEVKASGAGAGTKAQKPSADYGVVIDRQCTTTKPFVGQQVQCKTKFLYPRTVSPRSGATGPSADFRRFATGRPRQYQTYHQGRRYDVVEWNEVIVPTQTGKRDLPPFVVEGAVRELNRRGTPLDDFFGGGSIMFSMPGYKEETLTGEPLAFQVKPLPDKGVPEGFQGLIGDYQLVVEVSATQVKQGDTVTITIILSGRGISDHIPQPRMQLGDIGKTYADKPRYEEGINAEEGVTSVREFKVAFVPAKVGDFDLPMIEIPYFNPETGTYQLLQQDLGRLRVLPGDNPQNPELLTSQGSITPEKRAVQTIGSDLIGLHRHGDLTASHAADVTLRVVCVAVGGLPVMSALLFAGWLRFGQTGSRQKRQRKAKAGQRLFAGLARCEELVETDPIAAVAAGYAEVRDYLASRFDVEARAVTPRDVGRILERAGALSPTRDQLEALCERAANIDYGGASFTKTTAAEWLRLVGERMREVEER